MRYHQEYPDLVTPALRMLFGILLSLAGMVVIFALLMSRCLWRARDLERQPARLPEELKTKIRAWGEQP